MHISDRYPLGNGLAPQETAERPDTAQAARQVRDALSWQRKDRLLYTHFDDIVGSLDLPSLLVLQPGRTAPRTLDEYRLAPLKAVNPDPSTTAPGTGITMPPGVATNYRTVRGLPYMDTALGIGLVYKNELTAVAAAAFTKHGSLQIRQLQAVATAPPGRGKFSTGLHAGFYWRDTLVRAWMELGRAIGVDQFEIQSAANNEWAGRVDVQLYGRFVDGYDKVAERMGFMHDETTGDWMQWLEN